MSSLFKEVLRHRGIRLRACKMRKTQMPAEEEAKEPSTFLEELEVLDFRDDLKYK